MLRRIASCLAFLTACASPAQAVQFGLQTAAELKRQHDREEAIARSQRVMMASQQREDEARKKRLESIEQRARERELAQSRVASAPVSDLKAEPMAASAPPMEQAFAAEVPPPRDEPAPEQTTEEEAGGDQAFELVVTRGPQIGKSFAAGHFAYVLEGLAARFDGLVIVLYVAENRTQRTEMVGSSGFYVLDKERLIYRESRLEEFAERLGSGFVAIEELPPHTKTRRAAIFRLPPPLIDAGFTLVVPDRGNSSRSTELKISKQK